MRVIAGTARGVPLTAPKDPATRPITDRVKETLFGILGERVPGASVLDLYAGSGAIGIEALSRGAESVDFVERARPALATLRANLERTRLGGACARVHAVDVERFLDRDAGPWSLVVADPPYESGDIVAPLRSVAERLAPGGTLVLKHFWRTEPPAIRGLTIARQRRFGETMLTFMEADGT
jgi:16S rRNA (guanine966-N2)-methyltransferase